MKRRYADSIRVDEQKGYVRRVTVEEVTFWGERSAVVSAPSSCD